MKGTIYIVYIDRGDGFCSAYAFFYDEQTNEFCRCSSHVSSDLEWAKQDIRGRAHEADYCSVFPNGYNLIDVGVFKKPFGCKDYSDVMDAISQAHSKS